jgi:glycosyltransferase involved in cell wall biosynthesis
MDSPYAAILVIGGTKDLPGLWKASRHDVRIVQRLDGMNWIHRKRRTGLRHYLRAEYGNFILSLIRSRLANHIVYQSEFSQQWWQQVHGADRGTHSVVYNGVDLEAYSPNGSGEPPQDHVRILLVEGAIGGGYEWGLETGVKMAERVQSTTSKKIELSVAGRVDESVTKQWGKNTKVKVDFLGKVPADKIPALDRSAHVLYAADINAACPNSVIEALACGTPVVAFDTGALGELLSPESGRLVPYGGDPWRLEPPDIDGLAQATIQVLGNRPELSTGARWRAMERFGLDHMVDGYLEALNIS